MAKKTTVVLNCVGPVSNQPFFVSEQTIYSFLEESDILYSRGTSGQGKEELIQGIFTSYA